RATRTTPTGSRGEQAPPARCLADRERLLRVRRPHPARGRGRPARRLKVDLLCAPMDILSEQVKYGVTERRFDLKVGTEVVPGVVWLPEGASGPRPKVLFGHGGSQHKKVQHIPSFAKRLAEHGWASVALDAPGHGDRVSD